MLNRIFDRPAHGPLKRILLVSHSNPGDVVLTFPCYRTLQSAYPDSTIDIMVGGESTSLLKVLTLQGSVVTVPTKKTILTRWKFFKDLCRARYDLVIDLRNSYFGLAGRYGTGIFAARNNHLHRRDANLNRLMSLGVKPTSKEYEFPSQRFVQCETDLICIAPGSKSDLKRYPADRFAQLADRLIGAKKRIVWVGSDSDRALIEKIQNIMSEDSVSKAGQMSWNDFKNLLRESSLLITNDSAPLHLADDVGCPVLSLFGPTNPKLYGPQRPYSKALSADLQCQPCGKAQCLKAQRDCLESVLVQTVFEEALQMTSSRAQSDIAKTPNPTSKKILAIRLDRLGDVLLSFSALTHIKKHDPGVHISLMLRPHAAEIASRCPAVDRVVEYDYKGKAASHRFPFGYFKLLRTLRMQKYDEIIIFHPTFRSHLLAFLIGSKQRIGFHSSSNILLTHRIPDIRRYGLFHESRCVNRLTGIAWNKSIENEVMVELRPDDFRLANDLLGKHTKKEPFSFCVFHPGASAPSKRWPIESFARVAELIQKDCEATIVLVGDKQDSNLNRTLKKSVKGECVDLTGLTPLPVLAALMQKSIFVLTNDSGPAHLAGAVQAKVLSIFGRNEPGLGPQRWHPLHAEKSFIWKDYACQTCLSDDCPIGFACLEALTAEEVYKRLHSLSEATS